MSKGHREKDAVFTKGGAMKRILIGMMLLMLGVGMSHALTTDSVVLTVTPVFNLSVNIASDTHTFGSLSIKASATICVGIIEQDGNVTEGWQKVASVNGGTGGAWTINSTGSQGTDTFGLLAIATGTLASPTFAQETGSAADSRMDTDNIDGDIRVTTALSELMLGSVAAPTYYPGDTHRLWVSIMMPTNVTDSRQQTISLSVRAINR